MKIWQNFSDAISFYEKRGYKEFHMPWIVEKQYNQITCPEEERILELKSGKTLIGSSEQSLIADLLKYERYSPLSHSSFVMALTPCFRPLDNDANDSYHVPYFHKLELGAISFELEKAKNYALKIRKDAKEFFERLSGMEVEERSVENNPTTFVNGQEDSEEDLIRTDSFESVDLFIQGIEVGSYGLRKIKRGDETPFYWVYGTGLAEPRFSTILKKHFQPSYHNQPLMKADFQTTDKIIEEIREFEEVEKRSKITALCELADILGATESFIEKWLQDNFEDKVSLEDVRELKKATTKAFQLGKRK